MGQLNCLLHRVTDVRSSRRPVAFVKMDKNEKRRQDSDDNNIVPKGFLPLYVGKDNVMGFVIDATVLNHPLFAELLEASVQEFGYENQGSLRIPCDVLLFERILDLITSRHPTTLAICHQ